MKEGKTGEADRLQWKVNQKSNLVTVLTVLLMSKIFKNSRFSLLLAWHRKFGVKVLLPVLGSSQ